MTNFLKKKILPCIIGLLFFISIFNSFLIVKADNVEITGDFYSALTDEELKEIFSLEGDDILNPWSWIGQQNTFVVIENINGKNVYWWNTPNLQMSSMNILFNVLSDSGYGNGIGVPASKYKWLVEIPVKEEAKTALQAYGFKIQNPTYMGERPLIYMDLVGVVLPDGVLDTITRFVNFIFTGEVVGLPSDKNFQEMIYLAPRDYYNHNTFKYWVDKNWGPLMTHPDFKDGQILRSDTNKKGIDNSGRQWLVAQIIKGEGSEGALTDLSLQRDADYICSQLAYRCGSYYPDVARNLILVAEKLGIKYDSVTERIMPYDLSRMNSSDAELFNGIIDPRSQAQMNLLDTGKLNSIKTIAPSMVLDLSGSLSELAVFLDSCASFSFIENSGFRVDSFWDVGVINLLVYILFSFLIVFCVSCAFKFFTGSKSLIDLVRQVIAVSIIAFLVYGIALNPQNLYSNVKQIATSVLNIGNEFIDQDPAIETLYADGNAEEREQCELWLPYFNMWTIYHTSHGILEDQQRIMVGAGPETNGITIPKIGSTQQILWSTILADTFTNDKNYNNTIYRVVDHFMAPRINNVSLNDTEGVSFDVSVNENYDTIIQTEIQWQILIIQIIILFLVGFKLFLFIEFYLNLLMLIYNLALSVIDPNKVKKVFLELFASLLNVFIVNMFIAVAVWMSLALEGLAQAILGLGFAALIFMAMKALSNSSSVFTPKFLRLFRNALMRIKGAIG